MGTKSTNIPCVGVNLKYKSNIISKIITTNAPSSIDNVNMLIHIIAVKAVIIIVQGIKAIITDIPIITGHIVNKSLYPTFFFIRVNAINALINLIIGLT